MIVIAGSFLWWIISIYQFMTVVQPARGGQYTEAFVGQPRYLNPLLSHSSSADRSLVKLLFSGLFDYDENGLLREDIAERFEVSDDVREYTVFLRKDVKWHDGENLTVDDVIYTLDTAKNIAYGAAGVSNDIRLVWQDVKYEKIDDYTIKFTLNEPNSDFLHDLTIGLLPKHIWENITPEQFQLTEYNQKPIGSGPYEFVDLNMNEEEDVISSYTLRANKMYYRGEPFITKIVINFYPTRSDAVDAYKDGSVSAVIVDKKEHIEALDKIAEVKSIELPHYFAVFFNQTKSVPLAFDEVREALVRATDRNKIVSEVFGKNAEVRLSPFAQGIIGFDSTVQQASFDLDGAKKLLEEGGWKIGDDGVRVKDDVRLSFTLHISANHKELSQVAHMLKQQWKEIGVDLKIQEHEKSDMEANVLKPRDYDALLYAHQMRFEPNLLPLWHGDEKNDPGMNYALFDDEKMNNSLKSLLTQKDKNKRKELYKEQQERLRDEVPAIFLFAPKLSFIHSDNIKNIRANRVNTSYDRYVDIHLWNIKEKRVKK